MKIAFFFKELFAFLQKTVVWRNFKGLLKDLITLSKNDDVRKDLAIAFESSYVALLTCQVSLLWHMKN